MLKSLRRSLIESIILIVVIGFAIFFFGFPVWVDIVILLPLIISGMLSMTIEKKVDKENYKFLIRGLPSRLIFLCFLIPFLVQTLFHKFWNSVMTSMDAGAFFMLYIIGISWMCYCAGMLSVILKNERDKKDKKDKTTDPQV